MTTDFRALCAELLTAVDGKNCFIDGSSVEAIDHLTTIFDRIEIALATPPPEPPTDKELDSLWDELFSYDDTVSSGDVKVIARAALERWGHA